MAEQWLIRYRRVGSRGSVAKSHPRSSPAASLNWAGWEVLLPRLRVYLSRTCNEQRRRIARASAESVVASMGVCSIARPRTPREQQKEPRSLVRNSATAMLTPCK
ncbi:hypothetical protein Tsp_02323 [Trichinella spiralis]|uniref:hypothetical protein n=1 Tax=Trichinella spiralis TaxID=6334 RepID=UPI0001EFCCC8|nr:hypothetical protein Tsp_02323 [Trichinella spiralis]